MDQVNAFNQLMVNGSWEEVTSFVGSLYASKPVLNPIPPSNFLESWWLSLVSYLGDFYLLVAFYCFMNTCYLLSGIGFYLCDRFKVFDKYKIQEKKYATDLDYWTCAKNLIQNYIIIIFPLLYISYPFFTFLNFQSALPLPSIWTFCIQFAIFVVAEDVSHYFLHRMLHIPFFYRNIHKIHHQFASPFGLAASYAHPLEVLILGFCTFCGPLMIRPHFFTFYCWVLYRQLDAVSTHCGYDLPNPLSLIPLYGGTVPHDFHHRSFIFNYSSRFVFMDILFGTYKEVL